MGGVAVTKTAASTLADEVTFEIPWQAGDLALVDNYIAMHGRRTFSGTRKISHLIRCRMMNIVVSIRVAFFLIF